MKNNSICAICGKPYYTCNSCNDFRRLYPWKMFTDTSEHYKIYQIIHGYSIGVYNKEETKEKLQNVNLSDLETLIESIKNIIYDILGNENKVVNKVVNNVKSVDVTGYNKNTKRKKKIQIKNQ